ncbi:MAG: hypothetical protein ABIH00_01425 [Armatimonadota bacterium]
MKKYLVIAVVFMILTFSAGICAEKVYENNYFSFSYDPSVWNIDLANDQNNSVELKYNFIEQDVTLNDKTGILFQAKTEEGTLGIETIKEKITEDIKVIWAGLNPDVLSVEDVVNNGIKGVRVEFIGGIPEDKCRVVQYIYVKGNDSYLIITMAKEKEYDKAKPFFEKVMDTFKIK